LHVRQGVAYGKFFGGTTPSVPVPGGECLSALTKGKPFFFGHHDGATAGEGFRDGDRGRRPSEIRPGDEPGEGPGGLKKFFAMTRFFLAGRDKPRGPSGGVGCGWMIFSAPISRGRFDTRGGPGGTRAQASGARGRPASTEGRPGREGPWPWGPPGARYFGEEGVGALTFPRRPCFAVFWGPRRRPNAAFISRSPVLLWGNCGRKVSTSNPQDPRRRRPHSSHRYGRGTTKKRGWRNCPLIFARPGPQYRPGGGRKEKGGRKKVEVREWQKKGAKGRTTEQKSHGRTNPGPPAGGGPAAPPRFFFDRKTRLPGKVPAGGTGGK